MQKDKILEIKKALVQKCEECSGSGYIPAGDGVVMRCDCMIAFRYIVRLCQAGIPIDYWFLEIETLQVEDVFKAVVSRYCDNISVAVQKGMGLLFLGPNGIGKTTLMCEVGKQAIVSGISVNYFTLPRYITAIQKGDAVMKAECEKGTVLLIDELDKKYMKSGSDFVLKTVDETFRGFLNEGKSLILATNWNYGELVSTLGESTVSLLRRRCDFVDMDGEDFGHTLLNDYWERLTSVPDYRNPALMQMARKLEGLYE